MVNYLATSCQSKIESLKNLVFIVFMETCCLNRPKIWSHLAHVEYLKNSLK